LWIERERCYQLYEEWCVDNGISASNRAYFGQDLRSLIPKIPDRNQWPADAERTAFDGAAIRRQGSLFEPDPGPAQDR
jgi:hypothetical protein